MSEDVQQYIKGPWQLSGMLTDIQIIMDDLLSGYYYYYYYYY